MWFFSFIFWRNEPIKEQISTIVDIISSPVEDEGNAQNIVRDIPWINNYQSYEEYLEAYRLYLEWGPRASKVEIEWNRFKLYRNDWSSWYEDLPPRPVIDKRESFCPNCWEYLDKIPDRKKKCPHCSKYIYAYSLEVSPGVYEKHLRWEHEWKAHNDAIREEKEKFQEYVNSWWYLKDRLDEMKVSWVNIAIISGWWCEKCTWDRKMPIDSAYNISPTCRHCGYWYTVTWRIEL